MNKTTKIVAGVIVLVLVVGFAWYFQKNQKPMANNSETIKIGGLFALTGFASFAGEASQNGFIMAIEDSGMSTKYFTEDYQSDLKTAVTAATKLINVDKVSAVVGPEWVEFGEAVAPVANQNGVLFITPWNVKEFKDANSKYYFSATPNDRSKIKKEIQYMESKNIKKIVLVYSNNAFSLAKINMLKEELKNSTINIESEYATDDNSKDYKTEIIKIKQLNPEAIYTALATDDAQGIFNRQLGELKYNTIVLLDQSRAESDVFLKDFRAYSKGMLYAANNESSRSQEFSAKYKKRFGKEPTAISAATAYDATSLMLMAIKNGASNSKEIREYILKTKDYKGYSGDSIEFNQYGQISQAECSIREIGADKSKVIF